MNQPIDMDSTITHAVDTARNQYWFHIRYHADAPTGLPPIIQADQVIRYSDAEDNWVIALWVSTDATDPVTTTILRVAARHILAVTKHENLVQAASRLQFDRNTDDS